MDTTKEISFKEMTLVSKSKKFRVTFELLDEGIGTEPWDQLRFSCDVRKWTRNRNPYWEAIDDASYCTRMLYSTPPAILEKALQRILVELEDSYPDHKRTMEGLSWLQQEDFE